MITWFVYEHPMQTHIYVMQANAININVVILLMVRCFKMVSHRRKACDYPYSHNHFVPFFDNHYPNFLFAE